jgi:EpsI family protein
MPKSSSARQGLIAAGCLLLVVQAGASRMLSFNERKLATPGLHQVPLDLGPWKAAGEQSLGQDVADYLKPDDYILRDYQGHTPLNVFVAYFKSLEKTYGPHAPRICLPGSGWLETSSKISYLSVAGPLQRIPVNQLTYEKQDSRILVLYWYQNNRDVWADEFWAKLRLLPDLLKYQRSDVSLVRLVAPIHGLTPETELRDSTEFARLIYSDLSQRLGGAR